MGKSLSGYVPKFGFGGNKHGEAGESRLKGLRKQTENTEDAPLPGLSQVSDGQRSSCSAEQVKGQRGDPRLRERKSGLGPGLGRGRAGSEPDSGEGERTQERESGPGLGRGRAGSDAAETRAETCREHLHRAGCQLGVSAGAALPSSPRPGPLTRERRPSRPGLVSRPPPPGRAPGGLELHQSVALLLLEGVSSERL